MEGYRKMKKHHGVGQIFILIAAIAAPIAFSVAADAVKVSPTIVEKFEKLNSLRESNGLAAADRGNSCWVYGGKTSGGETKQACVVFIGDQRCVLSNFRGLRCGVYGKEAECKIKKTGDLRCSSNAALVKVAKRCYNNEYGERVCGAASGGRGRMPASTRHKRR